MKIIKEIIPEPVVSAIKLSRDYIERFPKSLEAFYHPWRRDTTRRLKQYKNRYQGERCFVIGNGPSLRKMDLTKLRNEYTFGMNRIYLMFPKLGFPTTFFVSINDLVIEQTAADIQKMNIPKFVSWRARKWLNPADDLYFLYTTYTGPKFEHKATGRLWEGATVTFVALQLAYYFGFERVILIGVDHSFSTKGNPNTTVISQGDDPDHFHPAYFGKGFRWQLPDLHTSELAYAMARREFAAEGREVVDATIGGKLTIFPKTKYDQLF
ncbi:MAG TPA: DUF115 domain-containing protein [Anaerolineae bacterium]|nr:DUF115 domain-containing protein [Anaerolineae bacterium]